MRQHEVCIVPEFFVAISINFLKWDRYLLWVIKHMLFPYHISRFGKTSLWLDTCFTSLISRSDNDSTSVERCDQSSSTYLGSWFITCPLYVDGIDTQFSVMAVTPQTPKCHHNRGVAEVVVTFGSLWCHSHDRKRGINFYSIMVPQN